MWRAATPGELGKALAGVRRSRGLNQTSLAEMLGVDRTYLARMEAGLSTRQLQRTFAALRVLGCELAVVEREPTGG